MRNFVKEVTKRRILPAALAAVVALTSSVPAFAGSSDLLTDISESNYGQGQELPGSDVLDGTEDELINGENDEAGGNGADEPESESPQNNDEIEGTEELEEDEENALFQTMSSSESDFIMMDGILFSYIGEDETVHIPEEVTTIASQAFKGNSVIREVQIPSTVISIGDSAFESCSSLRDVEIEEGADELVIGESAFASCSNLRNVTLPEGVTEIGTKAFFSHGVQFESIDIPASAVVLGENVGDLFTNMTGSSAPNGIEEINIADGNEAYYSYDGAVYSKEDNSLIYMPGARTGIYTISDEAEAIADNAFRNSKLDTVVIPEGVTEIRDSAFRGSKLTNIVIPGSVVSIGSYVFYNSTIETAELQNGIETIGDSAFETCYYLQSLRLPESVVSVGNSLVADNGSAFKWIWFDSAETEIGSDVVDYYMSIKIYGSSGSTAEQYVTAVAEEKGSSAKISFSSTDDFTETESIELDPDSLTIGLEQTVEINASITPTEAESVGISWSSSNSNIASVVRKKEGYTYVDKIAYITGNKKGTATITAKTADGKIAVCEVTVSKAEGQSDFRINESGMITGYIGEDVHIIIPAEVDQTEVVGIADNAFSNQADIESVVIPANVKSIGEEAFSGCELLEQVTIESGLEEIGESAFSDCVKLEEIVIPDSVTSIGKSAFSACTSLETVILSAELTAIEEETFLACSSLEEITIPQNVAEIGDQAFGRCTHLEEIVFESEGSLETIGASAFEGCYALQHVAIPEGVAYIGKYAFLDCNQLLSFSLPSTFSEFGGTFFYQMFEKYDMSTGGHLLTEITVADGNEVYQSYEGLVYEGDTLVFCPRARESAAVKEGTVRIGDFAFFICFELKRVELPSTLKSIGTNAFHNCEALEYCVLPEGLESIENSAFFACESWEDVIIPTTVTNLEAYSLAECAAKELIIPPNITRIEEYTFWGYEATLEKVVFPDTLEYIGDSAFAWAKNLKTIQIPEGVTYIGAQAFGRCDGLTYVSIPDSVAEIGKEAFTGSKELKAAYIPSSVETISDDIFKNAPNVITVFSDTEDSPAKSFAQTNEYPFAILHKNDAVASEDGFSAYVENYQNLIGEEEENVVLTAEMTDQGSEPAASISKAVKSSAKNYTAVRYVEFNVTKSTDNSEAEELLSSEKPLTFTIQLPSSLVKADRVYKVASVQNGKVTLFDASVKGNLLTAEINQYGSLAVLYKNSGGSDGGSSGGSGGSSKSTSGTISVDKNGDSAKISVTSGNLDQIIKNAKNNKVEFDLSKQSGVTNAVLPAAVLEKLAKESVDAKLTLPTGSIQLDDTALKAVSEKLGTDNVTLSLEKADRSGLNEQQKAVVGTGVVYDIHITAGDSRIADFDGGILTITLPYVLKDGESPDGIAVWYLNDSGELEKMNCTYDEDSQTVSFETDHLSYYMVGYDRSEEETSKNPFVDVLSTDWFYQDVLYTTDNGLLFGISENTFEPNTDMTRAMLVTLLWRMEKMPSASKQSFTDVADGMWYTDAISWAAENGIVYGLSDTVFAPDTPITREQMVQIFYRYAQIKGYDMGNAGDLSQLADQGEISDWAGGGIAWAIGNGLLYGDGSYFNPKDGAARAQVAALIHRFAEKYIK